MRIKPRLEQLSILPQLDEPLTRFYKFSDLIESNLSNLKFLHKQIEKGDVLQECSFNSTKAIREAQIGLAKMLVILGKEYEGKRFEHDFNYYYDVWIADRLNGYIQNPFSQADLFEMIHNQRMRLSGMLAQFKKTWQPFCVDLVKDIEFNLKQAQYALK